MDDIAERLRFKQQVADRLAGQRSGVRAPHCWFCGKIEPWFTCGCPKASAAQKARDAANAGDERQRNGYPRWNAKTNCIENLDAETIAFNESLGFRAWPVTPKPKVLKNTGVRLPAPSVTPEPKAAKSGREPSETARSGVTSVTPAGADVTPAPANGVTKSVTSVAERKRRQRERDRAKQGTPE